MRLAIPSLCAALFGATIWLSMRAPVVGAEDVAPKGAKAPAASDERWRGVDAFHPANQPDASGKRAPAPAPAYGGRATIHLEALPKSLNYALEGSAVARRILYELNETLLTEDWDTLELVPNLCERFEVEDSAISKDGTRQSGRAAELEQQLGAKLERIERATVFTFHLRPGVVWHDGAPFDARDVVFSAELYKNPGVNCGSKRAQFQKIVEIRALDPLTVRAVYEAQYFRALASIGDMTILPAHLYELVHPDHARYDAAYHQQKLAANPAWVPSAEEQAEYINKNPHNHDWVGLGPYQLKQWEGDRILAQRFERYFAPERGGFLDELAWRNVPDDAAAFQALLNGELDLFARLSWEDWFGSATSSAAFREKFLKAYAPSGSYWFVAWNLRREKLQDLRVRRALAMAFDFEAFKQSCYKGLATQVTGHFAPESEAYDRELAPLPFDPAAAKKLLEQAGWSDHDGDGFVDRKGELLSIEVLTNAGNAVNSALLVALQNDWGRVGVKLVPQMLEWNTLGTRVGERQFDGYLTAWALPSESDPEQAFHSRTAAIAKSSNFPGLADPEVDALIERGQRELDPHARAANWRALQRRLYELQPYLWGFSPPRKFALSQKLRGVAFVRPDPNYVARRWYWPAGTPGTRSTREKR